MATIEAPGTAAVPLKVEHTAYTCSYPNLATALRAFAHPGAPPGQLNAQAKKRSMRPIPQHWHRSAAMDAARVPYYLLFDLVCPLTGQ
jgi:hypothetical protein